MGCLTLFISAVLFIVGCTSVSALQCLPCDLSACPVLNCPGGIVDSPCHCCQICAKQFGEVCGGIWDVEGTCDVGLFCGITQDFGGSVLTEDTIGTCQIATELTLHTEPPPDIRPMELNCSTLYSGCNVVSGQCICLLDLPACQNPFEFPTLEDCEQAFDAASVKIDSDIPSLNNQDVWSSYPGSGDIPEDCLQARCEIVFDIQCPGDSVKIEAQRLLGECCPQPPRCECDRSSCPELLCGEGYERVIGSHGTAVPGSCCDIYECQPTDMIPDCTGIVCPESPVTMCPKDSRLLMGGISEDGCCLTASRCDCASDMCTLPGCWPGFAPKRESIGDNYPGTCCDTFDCVAGIVTQGCRHEDDIYLDGDSWEVDNCKTCECQGGMAHCVITQECYRVEDKQLCFTPSGFKAHGDKWDQDDCTACECLNGEMQCTMPSCATHCLNPRKVPGRCCPVCDEPAFITLPPLKTTATTSMTTSTMTENVDIVATSPGCPHFNCTLQCHHGYTIDSQGCRQCECAKDICPEVTCDKYCPYGFRKDENGCDICRCQHKKPCPPMNDCDKVCLYGYQIGRTGCARCRCERCTPIDSCNKHCTHGFETNDRGCQLCKCKEAGPASTLHPTALGSCLSLDGHMFEDGESWHDGCRECYCHNGQEMCSLITCPVPACEDPVIKQGECCPSCKDSDSSLKPHLSLKICQSVGGYYYVEGETWKMDACTTCVCHDGHVLCSTHSCPPLPCNNPMFTPGACCSACPVNEEPATTISFGLGNCLLASGINFENGATWKEDDCTSCKCTGGQVECYSQTCRLLDCEMPVLRKGQCCPTCIDTSPVVVCEFDSMTYVDGESWDVDHCIHCMCHDGRVGCSVPDCPGVLHCEKPYLPLGECCPRCSIDVTPTDSQESTILPPVVIQEGAKPSLLPNAYPTKHHKPPDVPHQNSSQVGATIASSTPDVSFMPPSAKAGFPVIPVVLSILVILLAICIILMMLLLVTKRRHRLLYNVSKKAGQASPSVMATSIKKKNEFVKNSNRDAAAAKRDSSNNRDSIRDSGCFKDNIIGKTNLDGQEMKRYQDMFAVGKTIQPV